jgi:hypothetical protein
MFKNNQFTCGWDKRSDAQVIEIDMKGKTVWKWFAVNCLENEVRPRRYNMERGGFFHANSAMRLKNGNTLISLKGYDMVLEVNPNGEAVWIKRGVIRVHDPSILENGNILLATNKPYGLYELSREGLVTWSYFKSDVQTITCCNRLPNGNTLVAARNNILELSAHGKVVWKLTRSNPCQTCNNHSALNLTGDPFSTAIQANRQLLVGNTNSGLLQVI